MPKIKNKIFFIFFIFLLYTKNSSAIFSEHQDKIYDKINQKNNEKVIYLTFDACGGPNGSQIDKELISFLKKNKIKSTIFTTSKFLLFKNNNDLIKELSKTKYFSIQNHGKNHKPASIDGKSIYGIKGTKNIKELKEEVLDSANLIYEITNKMPTWYRSGTAYYDSEAIEIINNLNFKVAGFSISVDEGATLSKEEILENIIKAKSGDILLIHINRPKNKDLRDGVIKGIKLLKKHNYKFEFLP